MYPNTYVITRETAKQHCRTCLRKLCASSNDARSQYSAHTNNVQGQKFIDISSDVDLQRFIAIYIDNNSWCTCEQHVLAMDMAQVTLNYSHYPNSICTHCYEQYLVFLHFRKQAQLSANMLQTVFTTDTQTQQPQQLPEILPSHTSITALPTISNLQNTIELPAARLPISVEDEAQLRKSSVEREFDFLNDILPSTETATVEMMQDIDLIAAESLEFDDLIVNINTAECDNKDDNEQHCDMLVENECDKDDLVNEAPMEKFEAQHMCNEQIKTEEKTRKRVAAFRCDLCKRRFVHKHNLDAHVLRQHKGETRPFACDQCDKKYKANGALRYHQRIAHRKNEAIQCNECGKYYRSEVSLKLHRVRQHLGQKRQKRFICELCGAAFFNPKTLHIHTRVKHVKSSEDFKCKVCEKSLQSPYSLKYHMLRHHQPERNCVCDMCGAGFARKFMLVAHMRNHISETQKYPCAECGKRFLTPTDVERHRRLVHLKIKPHVCQHCGEAFGALKTLRHHMYRHTGEKPYICEICGLGFRQPTSMKTHRKSHFRKLDFIQTASQL